MTTRAKHRVERLKGLVKYFMESRNIRSMKGVLNTISLRKNGQDSLILGDTTKLSVDFWRFAFVLNAVEWQEILSHLAQDHVFRTRFETPGVLNREPDTGLLRA